MYYRGKIANNIVYMIMKVEQTNWNNAIQIYQQRYRNNMDIIICVGIILCFLTLFRVALSWFTRYFDQIVDGVEKLSNESNEKITMCSELYFMEEKLNEVKNTLKMREEEARSAEKRKNDLVLYLAHDIKTPLTSVVGYLCLLDEAPDMPIEQKAKYVHIALEKAYRLETLINEFFEITRYNYQTVSLQKEEINLCYMMVQISDEMYPQLTVQNKIMNVDVPENIVVNVDANKMARAFNNILKNAIAYSNDNSPIEVRAQELDNKIIITMSNEGLISRDKLEHIFEKFYRGDDARSTSTGGAGLGLAIAKDIVLLHGGTINAESSNNVTKFIIELPKP